MKITTTLLAVGLGVVAASSARAGYSFASDADPFTTYTGQTHTIDIFISALKNGSSGAAAGSYNLGTPTITFSSTPSSPFSSFTGTAETFSVTGTHGVITTPDGGFDELITFTTSSTASVGAYFVTFNTSLKNPTAFLNTTAKIGTFEVDVVAAPEPAQTVAGAMLLGCGGLVFAGRRLFKKQSA